MKLKKKMKRMLEANLMNVILATEQQEGDAYEYNSKSLLHR